MDTLDLKTVCGGVHMWMGCARVTCVGFVGMQPSCGESSNAGVCGTGKAEHWERRRRWAREGREGVVWQDGLEERCLWQFGRSEVVCV